LIAVFGALTLYVLAAAAVIKLRISEPALDRPYRTPFYPVTPIIALVLSLFVLSLLCIAAMVWKYPKLAVVYAAIVAGAWLLFRVFVPKERRSSVV
jgi:ethanolamine permease